MQLIDWFHADPRRLCVLGVWLYLAGCAVTLHALVIGGSSAELLLGIALTVLAAGAKIRGREYFRQYRLSRHGVAVRALLQREAAR